MTQRIAIIGTGISGLTCAHLLHTKHEITVFEANDYIGGHTATVDVTVNSQPYAIDTGFIVYNDWTYPNFIKLMEKLGVETQATEMSFSVTSRSEDFEYNGHNLNSLLAQRRNILRPRFWKMLSDIVRFNTLCKKPETLEQANDQSLWDLLQKERFGDTFAYYYILPMCAAIWSTSLEEIKRFPLSLFLRFFNNHGLLNITNRPQWHTIVGGSRSYIAPMIKGFESKIHLSTPIQKVERHGAGWQVYSQLGVQEFDTVIFACHSDQALALLSNPTPAQSDILGNIAYADNEVVLHTDTSLLPKRPLAWASWNYSLEQGKDQLTRPATVTYNMNILQRLKSNTTFLVTLNNTQAIDSEKILRKFNYRHPQFNEATAAAQAKRESICGQDNLHFCGAYWYNGFHEDGVRSALDVCERFGARL
ncbi:NAD(P)/FAD-dependent oxidoreductase [Alteromonas sp. a30]|uniref:NAD(P)/FAD-dependent oxidoreductase n=1 Tax=Alteromonas sp. a30 TaxID=2730917 RepID=UPI00227E6750|nr:FAD-dependent oxidoreductase [Alteromonas sp. a30]MCY7297113.1 NAD(P)-binding protein [Alteromonas sp. a30]